MHATDASIAEVKQLLSFLDGAVIVPDARHHLWRSWGFCPRHTWLLAVVECELRLRPMGTAIIYEDLAKRASTVLTNWALPRPARLQQLRPRAACLTCEHVKIGRDDPAWNHPTQVVNRRRRFLEQVRSTQAEWEPHTCPVCAGGKGPVCRIHLLEGAHAPLGQTGKALSDLAKRLRSYYRSLTWQGPRASPRDQASWVEVLGWFAGWRYVLEAMEERQENTG
ncbi:MAG: hypothetical protein H5T84_03260 [Thermoleophilia bacterium]|nr:hypothetical protein [Thermoleophilia bacterium]